MADITNWVPAHSDPGRAETTRQFGDQLEITHVSQRSGPAAIAGTEDDGKPTFGGPRQRARTQRLPAGDRAQPHADAARQFPLREAQPASLSSQLIPRRHSYETTCAVLRRRVPLGTPWPRTLAAAQPGRPVGNPQESAFTCLTNRAFRRIVAAMSRHANPVCSARSNLWTFHHGGRIRCSDGCAPVE